MAGDGVTLARGVSAIPPVFDPVKIAVLGASESARNANSENTWPARFSQIVQDGGPKDVLVYDLAYHGATYFQAMNSLFYGTNTMVQECVQWKPDIIYVSFGGNDIMNQGSADQRTLAQVKTDADALYTALRVGCPSALIIAIIPRAHDNTNFATPSVTLKNKAIASQFIELTGAGVASGLWSNEMLEVGVSQDGTSPAITGIGGKTRVGSLESLATYITAGPSTSFNIVGVNWLRMDYWKLQRLGCTLPDQAHHNVGAHQLMAAWVYKGSKALTAFTTKFPRLSNQIIADWQDPDTLFSYYLTSSGDGWVRAAGADIPGLNAADINRFWGDQTLFSPEEWYLPWKTKLSTWPLPGGTIQNSSEWDGTFRLMVRGGPPTQLAYLSIDAAAWVSSGESTDTHGNFETTIRTGVFGMGNGSHTLRFKIGTESYGPYTYTISAPFNESIQTTDASTGGVTLAAAKVTGARNVALKMTGITGNAALTLPTAANIIAAIPNAYVGQTYRLRIINNGGAFTWTVTTNTGLTLLGTAHTIGQNTWREYEFKYTGGGTMNVECIGTGTWS